MLGEPSARCRQLRRYPLRRCCRYFWRARYIWCWPTRAGTNTLQLQPSSQRDWRGTLPSRCYGLLYRHKLSPAGGASLHTTGVLPYPNLRPGQGQRICKHSASEAQSDLTHACTFTSVPALCGQCLAILFCPGAKALHAYTCCICCTSIFLPAKMADPPITCSVCRCRFTWSQKIPTLIHAAIMTLVGVWVVFFHDWRGQDLIKQRNELVCTDHLLPTPH